MLSLGKIEQRDGGSTLVRGRVVGDHRLCALYVFSGELERGLVIVLRRLAVLLGCETGNGGKDDLSV